MLAIGELWLSANGAVLMRGLGAGCSTGWFCPLHFGNSKWPAGFMWRVQTIWAPLKVIVGFVEVQFSVYTRVPMARGATSPIGAVVCVGGRLQMPLFFGSLNVGWVQGQWAFLEERRDSV